jgi:hypothetical protein
VRMKGYIAQSSNSRFQKRRHQDEIPTFTLLNETELPPLVYFTTQVVLVRYKADTYRTLGSAEISRGVSVDGSYSGQLRFRLGFTKGLPKGLGRQEPVFSVIITAVAVPRGW